MAPPHLRNEPQTSKRRSQALASSRHINLNDLLASSFFKRRRWADFFLPSPWDCRVASSAPLNVSFFLSLFHSFPSYFSCSRPVFLSPPSIPKYTRILMHYLRAFCWCLESTQWLQNDSFKTGRNRVVYVPFVSGDLRRSFSTDLRRRRNISSCWFFAKGLLIRLVQYRQCKLQFQIILVSGK